MPNHKPKACPAKPAHISLRTQILPPNLGTDEEGQPYAPAVGSFYDTVVVYLANGAIYLYDSNGVYTNVEPADYDKLVDTVEGFRQALAELYNPAVVYKEVESYADLEQLDPAEVPGDQMILVVHDETHNGERSLYYYSPAAKTFVYAYQATPYYTKEEMDEKVEQLEQAIEAEEQARIEADNAEAQAREEADAAETAAREEADKQLEQRIEDVVNSPDVRYIVDTHADLEEIDKSTIGDQDYARVLQDETHEGASTYYQFSKESQEWTYVGMTGPYYTKAEIDDKVDELDDKIENIPTAVLYSEYGQNEDGALTQKFVSDKLNGYTISLGYLASVVPNSYSGVAIGASAQAKGAIGAGSVAIGASAVAQPGGVTIGYAATTSEWAKDAVIIGRQAISWNVGAVALGADASVSHDYSVSLGRQAQTTRQGEVSFGYPGSSIELCRYRYLANVKAGELDTDAVNVKQLNDAVGNIEAILAEINTGTGA